MTDEARQINDEIFNRIILGIAAIGLISGFIAALADGFSSPWFIRAMALLVIAAIVFILRIFGRFVVASYVLVLELIGLMVEMFLTDGAITSFVPYLLIPVVLIAGFLLSPLATLAVAVSSILIILLVIAVIDQMTSANLAVLLAPFGITLLAAFLMSESKRYFNDLRNLLSENRKLLNQQTQELRESEKEIEGLQQEVIKLQKQQDQANTKESQIQPAPQKDNRLYDLVKGTIQEIGISIEKLERVIEQFGEQVEQSYGDSLKAAWERIDYFKALMVNLSEMAQLEYGNIELNYKAVDVGRMISEVVGISQGLARGKELEIRYQVPDDLPTVQADPARLRQVLLHLLTNAINYTDQGIIEVQAELNEHELIIFVSDTGIGMHREEMELIFEKFGRGSGTLAQQRQGTGLGLAICKRLIELQGGRMWVTSVLGIGSTFYLTLPLETIRETSQTAATLIDRGLVKMPVRTPQPTEPVAAIESSGELNDEVTVTLPISSPTMQSVDDEETILSKPSQTMVRHSEQPIHRYGPTYIRRFGFILLSLLIIVLGVVAALAGIGYVMEQGPFAPDTTATASSLVTDATVTPTPSEVVIVQTPTHTPSPIPPTNTLQPTETPTPVPTDTATAVIPTPTTIAATATSVPTQEPTSTPSPTQTPTQTPTETPLPPSPTATSIPATPTAIVRVANSNPSQLSFVTRQAGGQGGFGVAGGDDSPDLAIETIANSRLSWSPTGQVLFAGDQGGNRDIFMVNPDNGEPIKLTTAAGDDLQPAWSPDGEKIAFSSGRTGNFEIYIMDADGSNPVQLTSSLGFDEWPVWSPDGQRIAFVSDRTGNVDIYTMDAGGSNLQRLTNNPADDWPAAWSPDGRRLVFASERDGNWNLYLIGAEGDTPPIRLTNDLAAERDPVWSPDGRSIAFAYDGSGNWDIYTLPVPTGSIALIPPTAWTQVTDTPTDERYPVWP